MLLADEWASLEHINEVAQLMEEEKDRTVNNFKFLLPNLIFVFFSVSVLTESPLAFMVDA